MLIVGMPFWPMATESGMTVVPYSILGTLGRLPIKLPVMGKLFVGWTAFRLLGPTSGAPEDVCVGYIGSCVFPTVLILEGDIVLRKLGVVWSGVLGKDFTKSAVLYAPDRVLNDAILLSHSAQHCSALGPSLLNSLC